MFIIEHADRKKRAGGRVPEELPYRHALAATFLILATLLGAGCHAFSLPPVDLAASGWKVRQGQAVWRPARDQPEVAGEIMLAARDTGETLSQFSKNPLPIVTAQTGTNRWGIEFSTAGRKFSGPGRPPKRLIWLYLSGIVNGAPPPVGWQMIRHEPDNWVLENSATGERLEGFLEPDPAKP